eukprot:CAMPEP_0175151702 /NCGR_PEP_ID=MMETSP0087-20121206/18674_1 /TAXON_ID=136419 /ORGANISM="Unknown Unknown, Strain D1" /LENGTH=481 /DNA_ID=CAMNT_0016437991 /DNA_START=41 /DNA_END=1486 /DNA_ORIENTATION=+
MFLNGPDCDDDGGWHATIDLPELLAQQDQEQLEDPNPALRGLFHGDDGNCSPIKGEDALMRNELSIDVNSSVLRGMDSSFQVVSPTVSQETPSRLFKNPCSTVSSSGSFFDYSPLKSMSEQSPSNSGLPPIHERNLSHQPPPSSTSNKLTPLCNPFDQIRIPPSPFPSSTRTPPVQTPPTPTLPAPSRRGKRQNSRQNSPYSPPDVRPPRDSAELDLDSKAALKGISEDIQKHAYSFQHHPLANGASQPVTSSLGVSQQEKPKGCNCKRSRCLKLYCECFAGQLFCGIWCRCEECYNVDRPEYKNSRERSITHTLTKNKHAFIRKTELKGCRCKRSGCLKKYCECFQAGAACTMDCRCVGCKNIDDPDSDAPAAKRSKPSPSNTISSSQSIRRPYHPQQTQFPIPVQPPQFATINQAAQVLSMNGGISTLPPSTTVTTTPPSGILQSIYQATCPAKNNEKYKYDQLSVSDLGALAGESAVA